MPGDYGKPRPCLVVQGSAGDRLPAVILCPLTSFVRDDVPEFRLTVPPNPTNGLRIQSQVMTDKLVVISREKLRYRVGRLSDEQMTEVSTALAVLLDLT